MDVRCGICRASTNVPDTETASAVKCSSCGREYSLVNAESLGATPAERSAQAEEFAQEYKLDLASAYSVLLGIISIETALSMSAKPDVADPRAITYDPGFRDAIEKGYLTRQLAVERGDRAAYASRLADRFGLDMDLALMLADNRIGVAEALKRKAPPAVDADTPPDPQVSKVRWRPLAVVLVLALVALCGWAYWSGTPQAPSGTPRSPVATEMKPRSEAPTSSSVEIVVDKMGALTLVAGPDPKSVLEAFCKHPQNRARLSPLSLSPSAVRSSGDQIGLVEDHEHDSALKAVVISLDPRSRRWRIGNGQSPIGLLDSVPISQPGSALQ